MRTRARTAHTRANKNNRPRAHTLTIGGAGLQVAQAAPASMTKYVDVVLALTIQVRLRT